VKTNRRSGLVLSERRRARVEGFTLIEIVLAVALCAWRAKVVRDYDIGTPPQSS